MEVGPSSIVYAAMHGVSPLSLPYTRSPVGIFYNSNARNTLFAHIGNSNQGSSFSASYALLDSGPPAALTAEWGNGGIISRVHIREGNHSGYAILGCGSIQKSAPAPTIYPIIHGYVGVERYKNGLATLVHDPSYGIKKDELVYSTALARANPVAVVTSSTVDDYTISEKPVSKTFKVLLDPTSDVPVLLSVPNLNDPKWYERLRKDSEKWLMEHRKGMGDVHHSTISLKKLVDYETGKTLNKLPVKTLLTRVYLVIARFEHTIVPIGGEQQQQLSGDDEMNIDPKDLEIGSHMVISSIGALFGKKKKKKSKKGKKSGKKSKSSKKKKGLGKKKKSDSAKKKRKAKKLRKLKKAGKTAKTGVEAANKKYKKMKKTRKEKKARKKQQKKAKKQQKQYQKQQKQQKQQQSIEDDERQEQTIVTQRVHQNTGSTSVPVGGNMNTSFNTESLFYRTMIAPWYKPSWIVATSSAGAIHHKHHHHHHHHHEGDFKNEALITPATSLHIDNRRVKEITKTTLYQGSAPFICPAGVPCMALVDAVRASSETGKTYHFDSGASTVSLNKSYITPSGRSEMVAILTIPPSTMSTMDIGNNRDNGIIVTQSGEVVRLNESQSSASSSLPPTIKSSTLDNYMIAPAKYHPEKDKMLQIFYDSFFETAINLLPEVLVRKNTSDDVAAFFEVQCKERRAGGNASDTEEQCEHLEISEMASAYAIRSGISDLSERHFPPELQSALLRAHLLEESINSFVFQVITEEMNYSTLGGSFPIFFANFFPKHNVKILLVLANIIVPYLANLMRLLAEKTLVYASLSYTKAKKQELKTIIEDQFNLVSMTQASIIEVFRGGRRRNGVVPVSTTTTPSLDYMLEMTDAELSDTLTPDFMRKFKSTKEELHGYQMRLDEAKHELQDLLAQEMPNYRIKLNQSIGEVYNPATFKELVKQVRDDNGYQRYLSSVGVPALLDQIKTKMINAYNEELDSKTRSELMDFNKYIKIPAVVPAAVATSNVTNLVQSKSTTPIGNKHHYPATTTSLTETRTTTTAAPKGLGSTASTTTTSTKLGSGRNTIQSKTVSGTTSTNNLTLLPTFASTRTVTGSNLRGKTVSTSTSSIIGRTDEFGTTITDEDLSVLSLLG